MIVQAPHIQKATKVRNVLRELDGTECLSRSPFIVASNDRVTLARLHDFVDDIDQARKSLGAIFQVQASIPENLAKTATVIAKPYIEMSNLDGQVDSRLNTLFLDATGSVIKSLRNLEVKLVQEKEASPEEIAAVMSKLNALDMLVDASKQVYQHIVSVQQPEPSA